MDSGSLESILKRDRAIVLAALAGVALVAWAHMAMEAHAMSVSSTCTCFGLALAGPDLHAWSLWQVLPLFLMWAEMMVAMMIPSLAPTALIFAAVNRRRQEAMRPWVPTGNFVLGYLAVWTAFSAAIAFIQWELHSHALLSPMMTSTSPLLAGALLVAAGLFQFTPLKHACLARCKSPLAFLTSEWREGNIGAFHMGWRHGLYCTACCWLLMALLFVAGVMNMLWVAAITVLVLLERLLPRNWRAATMVGVIFCGWGLAVIAQSL